MSGILAGAVSVPVRSAGWASAIEREARMTVRTNLTVGKRGSNLVVGKRGVFICMVLFGFVLAVSNVDLNSLLKREGRLGKRLR